MYTLFCSFLKQQLTHKSMKVTFQQNAAPWCLLERMQLLGSSLGDLNAPLTLRSQRPVQSCVCGSLVTESRNRTRWGRRSAPGRRTPSRHSSWRRSSGCRCSVEKQRMKKQSEDKSSRFGSFIRPVVHLSAGKREPDVTLRHRPTLIDTSSSSLCIHSSRSTEWNAM